MKKIRISLMTKLICLSFITMTILGVGSWYSMTQVSKAFRQSLISNFELLADVVGEVVASQFKDFYGEAQVLANTEAVRRLDSTSIPRTLNQFIERRNSYELIVVVDKKGKLISTNSKGSSGKEVNFSELSSFNFSETGWFKAVIAGETTDDPDKNITGTHFDDFQMDPLFKAAFGEERASTGFSAAIRDNNNNVIGVLSVRTSDKWITDLLIENLNSLVVKGLRETQISLINGNGTLIFESAYDAPTGNKEDQLKVNLVALQFRAAITSVGGSVGAEFMPDFRRGVEVVAGFQNIDSAKWISNIGWSVIVSDSGRDALRPVRTAMFSFYIILGSAAIIAIIFSLLFASALSKTFKGIAETLNHNADQVDNASEKTASHAAQLSQAASEQASALQQTVAAIDEINAMIEKNAESASRSIAVSSQSRQAAEHGRKIVDDMITAIEDIDHANQEITDQMNQSNRELSEITKLVNHIGSKTKIINEIVFQTKLLSFNASVEAARAGEYGKGFSVVAEEVGNLAQMSGNAAKEISSLLEESVQKVELVVRESKARVERLTGLAKDRVNSGSSIAKECNVALESILQNVQSVDSLVSEIAEASKEQSSGIHEISRAINEMEQMTEQNSSVAQSSAIASEQLKAQSKSLQRVVHNLVNYVQGKNRANVEVEGKPEAESDSDAQTENIIELNRNEKKNQGSAKKSVKNMRSKRLGYNRLKSVSGSDHVPKADDPRFEEE